MRVLLVEDDEVLRRAVVVGLEAAGMATDEASDLGDAEFKMDINHYDCIVFDRTLPSGDSLAMVEARRQAGFVTPVIFLTARDAVADRVEGLRVGGDDYLVKPFALDELVARITNVARRVAAPRPVVIKVGDLELDTARLEVRRAGVRLVVSLKEFRLLEVLACNAGTAMSRGELLERAWDEMANPFSNVVDVHIHQLRRKLGEPAMIQTVRGLGYMLEAGP